MKLLDMMPVYSSRSPRNIVECCPFSVWSKAIFVRIGSFRSDTEAYVSGSDHFLTTLSSCILSLPDGFMEASPLDGRW